MTTKESRNVSNHIQDIKMNKIGNFRFFQSSHRSIFPTSTLSLSSLTGTETSNSKYRISFYESFTKFGAFGE